VHTLLAAALVVHVTVALCDNKHQGIVPVPAAIGNGQDPRNNLYWGASYGLKSWLRREGWQKIAAPPARAPILETLAVKKTIAGREVHIIAEAWDGKEIRGAINSFLAGHDADVIAFIGHNGLMEFSVPSPAARRGKRPRAIVLACASRPYFTPHLDRAGAQPLLLTTGLMAPEAYTLTAAIEAWVRSGDEAQVREAAAQAYAKHQSCGIKGARRLFAVR
jgi:hypothetical protein